MRKVLVAVAVLGIAASAPARRAEADDPPTVKVVLDGQEKSTYVTVVEGDGKTAAPGDLVEIGGFILTRGTEPVLRVRREPGRLYLVGEGGKDTVVAAVAATLAPGQDPEGDVREGAVTYAGQKPEKDTLSPLTDAEIAGLRGVRLVNPSEAMVARLAKADPATCCFAVVNAEDDPVPLLPKGARIVVMGLGHSNEGPLDLAPLAGLSDLHVLFLGWRFNVETDLSPLAGLSRLRVLDLGSRAVTHAEALSGMKDLRFLDASGCENLADIGFARNMRALERLGLSRTPVADLAPLSGLPALREIDADASKVTTLPSGRLPALRTLRLLSAPVAQTAVDTFRKENPDCDVIVRRRDLLFAAIGGVDRIRVRSGGTCHRNQDAERTLAEVAGTKEVTALLDLVQFDDSKEMGCCMCCGSPTFELYAGATLVASLGFHHGVTLRWAGGRWPGDAHLTEASGDVLCAWLAERGITGPAVELAEQRRSEAAARHRDERQAALLPGGKVEKLQATEDPAAGADLLMQWFPEAKDRVLLAFRLLGASQLAEEEVVTEAARHLLGRVDADVALPIAREALAESGAGLGVAFWLLPRLSRAREQDVLLVPLFLPAARRVLSHPDPQVRQFGVESVARGPRAEAVQVLRELLAGRILRTEGVPAGTAPAEDPRVIERAVFALLRLGDRESLPRMREIASTWSAEQRAEFEEAVAELEAPDPGK
jgi:hypothetical protein